MMHAHDVVRWVLAIVFGLLGWWIIVMNFAIVYVWFVRKKHHSWVPLVGGFFAFAGTVFCPVPQIQRFAWAPLIIDVVFCISALTIGFLMVLYVRKRKPDA